MGNNFAFAFLLLFHLSPGGTYETYCSSGERLHTPREGHDVCIPCPHGTFIAEEHHYFRECKNCTEIENPDVEVLVSACNITHDTVILCTGGFYRRRARNIRQRDKCHKCTECPFPARPCEGYYNTVCCPPNHDAVMTPDGVFVCNKRPIVCGAGQFFRTSSEECLPCPAGTFMSDHSHTYKDCLKCEELSENNLTQAVITRPCSRIVPTLFGCKAGYFRDPTQESLHIEIPCTPCRICDRSLLDCDMFHDAVCDDEDLIVSTAPTKRTLSVGTTEGADVIKQLKTTLHGSVNSCIRDCIEDGFLTSEDSIAQSESSKRKCLSNCLPEIHNTSIVSAWLLASFGIVLLFLFNWVICLMQKNLAADNCRRKEKKTTAAKEEENDEENEENENIVTTGQISEKRSRDRHFRLITNVWFVVNTIGIIMFIFNALLETKVIEYKGNGTVVVTAYCCVVFVLNLVLIFVKYVTSYKKLLIAPGKHRLLHSDEPLLLG